jgi:2-dehydropantoate 2-reductase
MKIGVMGAGAIGCYVGGRLAANGRDVVLVGRGSLGEEIAKDGLRVSDDRGFDERVRVTFTTTPDALRACDVVLVTVKGIDTASAAREIAPHLAPDVTVVSLQNGVRNPSVLREHLPDVRVLGGMVPFNVKRTPAHVHRGTSGVLFVQAGGEALVDALDASGIPSRTTTDIDGILWGKLLLNLNNAINALSGLPIRDQLLVSGHRRLMAACMSEGLHALAKAGIRPVTELKAPLSLAPVFLRLPTPLFRLVARPMIRIDPIARSSMWDDLERHRKTEIDLLNGEVVALAERVGTPAPVNRAIVARIKEAESAGAGSPHLSPEQISS